LSKERIFSKEREQRSATLWRLAPFEPCRRLLPSKNSTVKLNVLTGGGIN